MDELFAVVSTNNPTVTLITESWLSRDILDNAINIGEKYNTFRLDRPTPAGGVLIYVDTTIPIDLCASSISKDTGKTAAKT